VKTTTTRADIPARVLRRAILDHWAAIYASKCTQEAAENCQQHNNNNNIITIIVIINGGNLAAENKSEAQNFDTGYNFTKNLVKNLVIKQSSYTSSSWLSSNINNNNNNNNSTSSAAEVEQKILNIIVQKSTVFFFFSYQELAKRTYSSNSLLNKSLQNIHEYIWLVSFESLLCNIYITRELWE
jgi:hypothetical protein